MRPKELLDIIYGAVQEVRGNASIMLLTTAEQVLSKHGEYREKIAKCDEVLKEIEELISREDNLTTFIREKVLNERAIQVYRGKTKDGRQVEGNLIITTDVVEGFEAIIVPTKDNFMFTDNHKFSPLDREEFLCFEVWDKVDIGSIERISSPICLNSQKEPTMEWRIRNGRN